MFFIFRTVTRGTRRPRAQQQKPAGPPMTGAGWVLAVVFLIACSGLTALFKHAGASDGAAFLESFATLVVVLFVIAGLSGGSKGPKVSADEIREAVQQAANNERTGR